MTSAIAPPTVEICPRMAFDRTGAVRPVRLLFAAAREAVLAGPLRIPSEVVESITNWKEDGRPFFVEMFPSCRGCADTPVLCKSCGRSEGRHADCDACKDTNLACPFCHDDGGRFQFGFVAARHTDAPGWWCEAVRAWDGTRAPRKETDAGTPPGLRLSPRTESVGTFGGMQEGGQDSETCTPSRTPSGSTGYRGALADLSLTGAGAYEPR